MSQRPKPHAKVCIGDSTAILAWASSTLPDRLLCVQSELLDQDLRSHGAAAHAVVDRLEALQRDPVARRELAARVQARAELVRPPSGRLPCTEEQKGSTLRVIQCWNSAAHHHHGPGFSYKPALSLCILAERRLCQVARLQSPKRTLRTCCHPIRQRLERRGGRSLRSKRLQGCRGQQPQLRRPTPSILHA